MGAEPVVVLYASISVLNWMRAATGSQCKETKRGVTWALLGSLKTSRAAAESIRTRSQESCIKKFTGDSVLRI